MLWTLAIAASVVWNTHLLREAMFEAATTDARSDLDMDVLYRHWAALHGSVYVPVTALTPPNPYLTNVVERDLVTPSGRRLTLMNPDYMTRQVHELQTRGLGRHSHITSLKPLRPENAPDSWEAAGLRAFEQGRTEVNSRELLHGEPCLRLMKPLVAEAGCLKCHAAQGHHAGELRGGISVTVPLDPYLDLARLRTTHIALAHAGLWALGALAIFLAARQMRQRLDQQLQAELEVQHQAAFARFNPNPVLELSAAGEINYFNDAAGEAARALGRENPAQMLPLDTPAMVRECLAAGQPKLRVETLIGSRVMSWSFFPVKFNHTVHCYAGDITERKRAEEALRASQQLIEGILNAMPVRVFWKDKNLVYLGCNAVFARDAGFADPKDIIGKDDYQMEWRKQADSYRDDDRQVIESGCSKLLIEELQTTPEGKTITLLTSKLPLRDSHGEISGLLGMYMDITERKQAENKLRQLSRAVEQSPALIVITDPAGDIEYANPKFIELTGYTLAEVLGKNPRLLKSGEKSPQAYRELWQTITSGKEWRGEFHNKKKNGELYWESASISPIRDLAGRTTHYVAVKEDITERKRAEAALEKAYKALVDVSRQAGMAEVATNVLHNVGNVLNSVNISTTLIVQSVKQSRASSLSRVVSLLQEHAHDLGEFITHDSRGKHLPAHLAQLSEHLLAEQETNLSELALLRQNIEHIKEIVAMQQNYATFGGVKEIINVVNLVEDSLRLNEDALSRHDVEVIREFETVPPLNLEKHKFLQIMVNLLRNAKLACQDSERADKRLTVRVANGEGRIRISVIDNGVGIPPENLTRIFNYGFTTRKGGHGFGLHSGSLAAKEMGGSLTVHSDGPGQGAEFTLELPCPARENSHE
jgi:PAS domain S-box-containing protein